MPSSSSSRSTMEAPPILELVEKRLQALLREVEKRERIIADLTGKLEQQFLMVQSLMDKMRALGHVPAELRNRVREVYSTIFALANEVDEIREELAANKEMIQRVLALIELLKERGARR